MEFNFGNNNNSSNDENLESVPFSFEANEPVEELNVQPFETFEESNETMQSDSTEDVLDVEPELVQDVPVEEEFNPMEEELLPEESLEQQLVDESPATEEEFNPMEEELVPEESLEQQLTDESPATEEEFNPMEEELVPEESMEQQLVDESPAVEEEFNPMEEDVVPVLEEAALGATLDEEMASEEPVSPLVACLTELASRKVRTPDGEQEFALGELIDAETGEALDLTTLIPEDLFATVAVATAPGFVMGGETPSAGGFDMSASEGESETGTKRKKRAPKPKSEKKKGGIGGIFFGGLLALIIFPYALWLIETTTGLHSNIPVPAPGIVSTYKYIPKWWPDWAMFCFPGRTAENSAPADDAKPADKPVKDDAAVQVDENGQNKPGETGDEAEAENPDADADNGVEDEAKADQADVTDDDDFDPDAFMANDDAKPAEEAEVVEKPADETAKEATKAEPGVVNAPTYTAQDVSDAITAVGVAFKKAKAIDDTVYVALSDMAEKSTFVDTSKVDAQLKDCMAKVGKAMEKFGTKAELAVALSEKLATRVDDATDNAGILFVGKLSALSERDGYQIAQVDIEGKDGLTVEVVGLRKIKPTVGDRIVVCGKRIAEPAKNLGGFSDNGVPVIWGGKIIKADAK